MPLCRKNGDAPNSAAEFREGRFVHGFCWTPSRTCWRGTDFLVKGRRDFLVRREFLSRVFISYDFVPGPELLAAPAVTRLRGGLSFQDGTRRERNDAVARRGEQHLLREILEERFREERDERAAEREHPIALREEDAVERDPERVEIEQRREREQDARDEDDDSRCSEHRREHIPEFLVVV